MNEAAASGDAEKLIRYARLHFGDGDEAAGRGEIDKAWIEALKLPKPSKRKRRMPACLRPPDRFAIRASRSCSA